MKSIVALVFALAAVSPLAADTPPPTKIEVFTDRDYPVTAHGHLSVDIYRLDVPGRIEHALSTGLPADPVSAKQIAVQRVRQIDSSRTEDLKWTFEGLIKARQYRLDRLPAIVFDGGRTVVYGVMDLEAALSHYRQWHQAQGRGQP